MELDVFRGRTDFRRQVKMLAVEAEQRAKFGLADADGVLQHGLEHWLQIAGRRTDDAQHVSGRRLLLKRLAQFIEQPRVLDGDDRLGGEILQQFNLFVGEGAHLVAIDRQDAD